MTPPPPELHRGPPPKRGLREVLFLTSVWFKGLDGLIELVGGFGLLSVSPAFILRMVRVFTQDEITEDPRDLVANALRHMASNLSISGQHFVAVYLLVHSVVKVGLVWALLDRILIAYPISIAIFGIFIVYQLYRYSIAPGPGLLLLTAVDLVVIWLIYLEYRALHRAQR